MTDGVTLRQLSERGVAELRGVGPKKVVALHEVGVDSILDLLTTYPRRWVDRTEEARVIDLVPGREALVLVTVRSVSRRTHPQPAHHGHRAGGRRLRPPERGLLQPAVAGAPAPAGPDRRPVRPGRHVPGQPADDEPGGRPHRRPHGAHRPHLPPEREGRPQHLGDGRLGGERPRALPGPGHRRPGARAGPPSLRSHRPAAGAVRHPRARRRWRRRRRPAGAWPSTSCCGCSSSSSCARRRWSATPRASATTSRARWSRASTSSSRSR